MPDNNSKQNRGFQGVQQVPFHTHNGIDSPSIQTTVNVNAYCGQGLSGGSAGTPFPTGWTMSAVGTGQYVIVHNLGSTNYAVTANAATAGHYTFINQRNANDFHLTTTNGGPSADDFYFIVVTS